MTTVIAATNNASLNVAVPNVANTTTMIEKISMQLTTQTNPFPFYQFGKDVRILDVSYAF